MGVSEVALHVFSGTAPAPAHSYSGFFTTTSQSHLALPSKVSSKYGKRCSPLLKSRSNSRTGQRVYRIKDITYLSRSLRCMCQQAEGTSGFFGDGSKETWLKEPSANQIIKNLNGKEVINFSDYSAAPNDNTSSTMGTAELATSKKSTTDIEDEAWRLLQESMVYYCGSPVGTIAAKDPSDSNVLNYDQVFIRDFIPSGIAFLLKGEYDIVRNFILHTLQLQSWEKTMDCHSPGQGLMPASFKVRTIPLDGDDSATEEVLDPDFGEAAIGRVAPVDSGLWWIILLRAYGKCSGDLSVQERIDVQTGIKMILKLCLADGFDMFPTLLVTDGSCMIDRRMGIHGHPLEIQVENALENNFKRQS